MKMKLLLVASFLSVALLLPAEEGDKLYLEASATEALIAKEGQKVIVYGETENSAKSASGTNFVNFKGAEFYLITFKSDLDQFPEGEPFELFDAMRVAIEGAVSIYQDKPQIKLTSPDQVTVLAADEVFPPVVAKPKESAPAKEEMKGDEAPEENPVEEEPKKKPPVDASEFFD